MTLEYEINRIANIKEEYLEPFKCERTNYLYKTELLALDRNT